MSHDNKVRKIDELSAYMYRTALEDRSISHLIVNLYFVQQRAKDKRGALCDVNISIYTYMNNSIKRYRGLYTFRPDFYVTG